jgi:hypothetical protein
LVTPLINDALIEKVKALHQSGVTVASIADQLTFTHSMPARQAITVTVDILMGKYDRSGRHWIIND